jgi:tetratricopeptide (TPR) repeat protein
LKQQYDFAEVLPLLLESSRQCREIGDLQGEAFCLREILEEPISAKEALELSDQALMLAAKLQDDEMTASLLPLKLQWLVEAKEPDGALALYSSYYNSLLALSPELHFPLAQLQIARALLQQHRFDESSQQLDQAVQTFNRTGNARFFARGLAVQGELYMHQSRLHQAHACLERAAGIAEDLNDRELMLQMQLELARILTAEKQSVKLLQTYLRALKLAEETGRVDTAREIKSRLEQLRL